MFYSKTILIIFLILWWRLFSTNCDFFWMYHLKIIISILASKNKNTLYTLNFHFFFQRNLLKLLDISVISSFDKVCVTRFIYKLIILANLSCQVDWHGPASYQWAQLSPAQLCLYLSDRSTIQSKFNSIFNFSTPRHIFHQKSKNFPLHLFTTSCYIFVAVHLKINCWQCCVQPQIFYKKYKKAFSRAFETALKYRLRFAC